MSSKRKSPFADLPRGISILTRLAMHNNEFQLFWLIGVLLHIIAFDTFNPLVWLAIGVMDFAVGVFGVIHTVRPVELAFAVPGISFSPEFGTPKWILGRRYPCMDDTIEFTACGIPSSKYQDHIAEISTRLNLPIKDIRADRSGAQRLYAQIVRTKIPSRVDFNDIKINELTSGEVFYGMTDHGAKKGTLRNMVHLLVAGQTGGGKTVFIQQIVITTLAQTKTAQAVIIDMKGGVDFQDFKQIKSCNLFTTVDAAHVALDRLYEVYKIREAFLAQSNKRHWYDLSPHQLKSEQLKDTPVGPIIVVSDELAELTGYRAGSVKKESIHFRLSELARLSRSMGFHLILGTQRPDSKIIDGQVKGCLITRVCFSVPSIHDSILVINNKSAYTIGRHPGRAILDENGIHTLIQTPWLRDQNIRDLVSQINKHPDSELTKRSLFSAFIQIKRRFKT